MLLVDPWKFNNRTWNLFCQEATGRAASDDTSHEAAAVGDEGLQVQEGGHQGAVSRQARRAGRVPAERNGFAICF